MSKISIIKFETSDGFVKSILAFLLQSEMTALQTISKAKYLTLKPNL